MDSLKNGAKFEGIPQDAMNVKIDGTPEVVLKLGEYKGGFQMAAGFRQDIFEVARQNIDLFRQVAGLPAEVHRTT